MLRTGKTPEITVRSAISAPPSFRKLHCGGQKQPNSLVKQIGLIPRRQAAGRSAERAHVAIASQPTPYALPSWSQKTWLALARLRRETRPGERLLALRRRWHEGTADTTLLTSFRACGLALLPGHSHNTHCPFGRSCFASTLILFSPPIPRHRDPSAGN